MHPALSIIAFTVITGLAYGWAVLAIFLDVTGIASWQNDEVLISCALSITALLVIGLSASVLHLAKPSNAWRSVLRVRTSWLSREAVCALLFFPVFAVYLSMRLGGDSSAGALWAWMSVVIAALTVFSTGMIYACLRTIRQWHTPLVPINYLLLALALGALALYAHRELAVPGAGAQVKSVVLGCLILALIGKVIYWLRIGLPQAATINAATGFRMATVRLLDVGHTAGTFLTDEFGFEVSRSMLVVLKVVSLILAFGVPIYFIANNPGLGAAFVALACAFAGLLLERWLFFAEAQHVVRLYHGQSVR